MRNPFLIEGPALISTSGGRTSGRMLYEVLQAGLQSDVHIVYANTGKEREETLDFIHEMEKHWQVPIRWVEWTLEAPYFREVDYYTASRNGEPFEGIIRKKRFLPNPVMRYCTIELKIRTMKRWMVAQGYEHWTNVIGIRADEPRRAAKAKGATRDRWENALPLYEAGITEPDVLRFWREQPFDLQLNTYEGNCDLCFLKAEQKRIRIMQDRPGCAEWWERMERETSQPFRAHGANYSQLIQIAGRPSLFDGLDTEDLADCVCGD